MAKNTKIGKIRVGVVVFALIGALFLVALGVLGISIIGSNGLFVSVDSTPFKERGVSNLQKVETSDYIFYYPDGFVKVNGGSVQEQYQSTNLNSGSWYSSVNLVVTSRNGEIKNQTDCNLLTANIISDFAQLYKIDLAKVKGAKTKFFDYKDMLGCDMGFQLSVNDKTIYIDQIMFTKAGKGSYVVSVSYDNESNAEYNHLKAAQEKFIIK